jgi:cytoskeleton protein RodZ
MPQVTSGLPARQSGLATSSPTAPTATEPSDESTAAATAGAAPRPGDVTLRLSFAADCWVEIYDGTGKTVAYDLGQAGTQRVLAAAAPLSVTLGNAPAVKLQVNGRDVATPVPPAGQTVARFGIGPDGSLR